MRHRNELPDKTYSFMIHWFYRALPTTTECLYINKMLTIQKEALRIISNSPTYCHTSPIFMILGILIVYQHIQYHALIFMLQQQNYLLPNL